MGTGLLGIDAPASLERHYEGQQGMLELLRRIADTDEGGGSTILAVTDSDAAPYITKDFPTAGGNRVVLKRSANGLALGPGGIVAAGGAIVLGSNENRLGSVIVNNHATVGVTLYAADSARAGVFTIWLAPNGGQWNLNIGDLLWCGAVFAVPAGAVPGSLTGGEI